MARLQGLRTLRALGFTRKRAPMVSTPAEGFTVKDPTALESAPARWAQAARDGAGAGIALEGKALGGGQGCLGGPVGVPVVAASAVVAGRMLAQSGDGA